MSERKRNRERVLALVLLNIISQSVFERSFFLGKTKKSHSKGNSREKRKINHVGKQDDPRENE